MGSSDTMIYVGRRRSFRKISQERKVQCIPLIDIKSFPMSITALQNTRNNNQHHTATLRRQRNQGHFPLLHNFNLVSNFILGFQDATLPFRFRREAHLPVRLNDPFCNSIRLVLARSGDFASNVPGDLQVLRLHCFSNCNCGVCLASYGIASTDRFRFFYH